MMRMNISAKLAFLLIGSIMVAKSATARLMEQNSTSVVTNSTTNGLRTGMNITHKGKTTLKKHISRNAASSTAFCPSGSIEAKVEVMTDYYNEETSWKIKNTVTNQIVESRDEFPDKNTWYEDTVCLPETTTCGGTDYSFTISDSYGDGICCGHGNGYYKVSVEDEVIVEGGDFTYSESTSLCSIPSTCYTIHDFVGQTFDGIDPNDHTYSVTLGAGYFYQQTSPSHLVGSFDEIVGNTAYYKNGDSTWCDYGKAREGSVELVEDASLGNGEMEVSFSEPAQCVYKTVIAVQYVCDY